VGDYRVVYEINEAEKYIEVRVVAHRKDVVSLIISPKGLRPFWLAFKVAAAG
jgi:hypothetical protein